MILVRLDIPSPAMRAGLRALLMADQSICVIDDSLNDEKEADVVITSASPSFDTELETDSPPSAGTLFLSDGQLNVQRMKRLPGAWGILPTDSSAEELSAAIHALSQGLIVGTASMLFDSGIESSEQSPLTDRELEVLENLARGLANKQIAVSLGISEHTVKFHVSSIYSKLNVTNRTEAVREGLRGGWIAL